ncbi:MAG: nicotinic acid mononucleotide adenylyltransferase, partial [Limnothrix sp.]
EKAKAIWGEEAEILLVIGADIVGQIHHWYRAKDLLRQVTLLIFPRKGYPIQTEVLEQLTALKSKWQIAAYVPPSVSSSEYRIEGEASAVIGAIADYIKTNKLYQLPIN